MNLFKTKLITEEEEQELLNAIRSAEGKTSGEIRVHLDKWCKNNAEFKARNVFQRLKMSQTEERNGVLIYVAIKEKKFAILGDEGINGKVPQDFWVSTADLMSKEFHAGSIVRGIAKGVENAGIQLAKYFPLDPNDVNELPDEITYG